MSTPVQQGSSRPSLRRIRLALMCFSVGANAICAGGIYCFPIISPALATHLKLSQPQLTTIALAGMMGQYPIAAFVGKILDYYGAWVCSLISACLFLAGFGLFANQISTSDTTTHPSASAFHNLVIFFFICGLATVFSYFSSVFAASKNFPNYIGMTTGITVAIFGLSPTFLSLLASRYFSSADGEIDVSHFTQFLAILCGCVHLIGGFTLHIIPSVPKEASGSAVVTSDPEAPNERTALLPNKTHQNDVEPDEVQVDVTPVSDEPSESKDNILDLLLDRNFWALLFISFIALGSCEMIISNIGTIVISLPIRNASVPSVEAPSTALVTSTQVRILSISNTLSRLITGPLADIISPVPLEDNRGVSNKYRISRVFFLTVSTALLVCAYGWMAVGVRDQASLWLLSIGAGLAYGCIFTVLPSLISTIWGIANLGRNFGVVTYSPFLGTPVFSYLYAFVSDAHVGDASDGVCHGPACWTTTFEVSALAVALACVTSVYLWRAWKGRV